VLPRYWTTAKGFIGHLTKSLLFQHIMKSLTVDNIGYEVFSPFAAAFETIRKVRSLSINFTNENPINLTNRSRSNSSLVTGKTSALQRRWRMFGCKSGMEGTQDSKRVSQPLSTVPPITTWHHIQFGQSLRRDWSSNLSLQVHLRQQGIANTLDNHFV